MTDVRTAPYAAEEKRGYRTAKRVFDILLSFPLGILSLIPMGILAAVIVCKDGGNPFYGQSRVGQNGQEFRLIKLRSMKRGRIVWEMFWTSGSCRSIKKNISWMMTRA